MSSYTELLGYSKQLERRLAALERQEAGGAFYSRSEADAKFLTILDAAVTYIDNSAYGDFLLATGQATGALIFPQWFSRGVIAGDGIWGSGDPNGDLILEGTSDATKTSSYVLVQPNGGNVGIGRTPLSNRLEVAGVIYNTDAAINAHTTEATAWAASTNAAAKVDLATDATNVGMSLRVAKGTQRYTTNATTVGFLQYGSSVDQFELVHGTNTRITVASNGNVGIGAAPGEKLEVNGNALIPNNSWYKAKTTGGTAIQLLGIDGNNDVFMGAVGNAGGAVYIREDGSNVITITGGTVGIGTAVPGEKLSVAGQLAVGGALQDVYTKYSTDSRSWWTGVGAVGGDDKFVVYDATAPAIRMTIDTDGKVGIGTTSPLHRLSVYSATDNIIHMSRGNNANWNALDFLPAGALSTTNVEWAAGIYPGTSNFVLHSWDGSAANVRLAIAAGGTVGVGTMSPGRGIITTSLDIQIPYAKTDTTARYGLHIGGNDTNPLGLAIYNIGSATAGDRVVGIQASELGSIGRNMALNAGGGNVGIGTHAPAYTLDVNGTGRFGAYAIIGTSVSGGYYQDSSNGAYRAITSSGNNGYYFQTNGGGSTTMYVGLHGVGAGNVGIGTTNPQNFKLQVEGRVGIKTGVNAASAMLWVNQDDNGATIPVLRLSQSDLSEEFIYFNATVGAGNPIDTAALGTYYGKVRVSVNGTFKYMPLYNS